MNYKIVADSSCDLTQNEMENLNVLSVPLKITVGDKTFVDDDSLNLEIMLDEIKKSKNTIKTSCPSPDDYINAFMKSDVSFGLTISSNLSGSYNSAMTAKEIVTSENPDKKIHIFNSLSASAGEILVAFKIDELIKKALDYEKIIEKVEDFIKGMKTFFVLENVDTLVKSGRMNKILGKIVTVMSIRPVLGSDGQGHIKLFDTVRGTANALSRMVKMIGDNLKSSEDAKEKTLVITHCNCLERAVKLKDDILNLYNFKDIKIFQTRGLSSSFANEGGIVIAY